MIKMKFSTFVTLCKSFLATPGKSTIGPSQEGILPTPLCLTETFTGLQKHTYD